MEEIEVTSQNERKRSHQMKLSNYQAATVKQAKGRNSESQDLEAKSNM